MHCPIGSDGFPNGIADSRYSAKIKARLKTLSRTAEKSNLEALSSGSASAPSLSPADLRGGGDQSAAYKSRITYLQNEAAHDGYAVSPASEFDFWRFVRSAPDKRRANLVLIDNGNLRAIWSDEHGSRLGLQFLGGGVVQYVIFKRQNHGQPMSRVTGRDSLEGLARLIDAHDLLTLIYE